MKFQLLVKSNMLNTKDYSCFQTLRYCIYHAYKYQNANNKFHAQLSLA